MVKDMTSIRVKARFRVKLLGLKGLRNNRVPVNTPGLWLGLG